MLLVWYYTLHFVLGLLFFSSQINEFYVFFGLSVCESMIEILKIVHRMVVQALISLLDERFNFSILADLLMVLRFPYGFVCEGINRMEYD